MRVILGSIKGFFARHLMTMTLFLLILVFLAGLLYPLSVITIPSGRIGVLWHRFSGGTNLTTVWDEGIHLTIHQFSTRPTEVVGADRLGGF